MSASTASAIRKMPGVGTCLTTPRSWYVSSALLITAAPRYGPISIGIRMAKTIRSPCT